MLYSNRSTTSYTPVTLLTMTKPCVLMELTKISSITFYLSSMAHQGEDKSSPSVESSGLGEITKTERVG